MTRSRLELFSIDHEWLPMLRDQDFPESHKFSVAGGQIRRVKNFCSNDDAWAVRQFAVEAET